MPAGAEPQNLLRLAVDMGQTSVGIGDQDAVDRRVENIFIADRDGHPAA